MDHQDYATGQQQARNRDREAGDEALRMLVRQFSGKFDFIRELVQNSLDSGTATVEVWTDYRPLAYGGVCEIHVDDNGQGMDEAIIDGSLTKLFSSTKEDDLTNIGKFGIGFASVFSIEPDGVLVRTARGGERWEVFFNKDRTFEKSRLSSLIEGTKITVFKQMDSRAYPEVVSAVREMLQHWCKHAEKHIVFFDRTAESTQGASTTPDRRTRRLSVGKEVIAQPFAVEGDFPVLVEKEQARIAMAFSKTPFFGFYNRGLTIKETDTFDLFGWAAPFFENITFKIKSPFLEHTLTRDTLLLDDNYEKALLLLVNCARGDLVESLLLKLEAWAAEKKLNAAAHEEYLLGLEWLYRLQWELDPTYGFSEELKDISFNANENIRRVAARVFSKKREKRGRQRSIDASFRKIFRKAFGRAASIGEVRTSARAASNRVILSANECTMTEELCDRGYDVFISRPTTAAKSFFSRHVTKDEKAQARDLEDVGCVRTAPSIIGVGDSLWLMEPVQPSALHLDAQALLSFVTQLASSVRLDVVSVNFLGDDPTRYLLGGRVLKGGRAAAVSTSPDDGTARVFAVDVYGSLFGKLTKMFGAAGSRETAMRIAAAQLAACAKLDAVDRLVLQQRLEGALS